MARTLKWKQKAHNGGLGSEKTSNPMSAVFLSEGEKFLGGKTALPLFLNHFMQLAQAS